MKAIDAVIAISNALGNWDGTPDQAAEKIGAAVAIVKAYASTPAPELTTTDKAREEAREFIRQLEDESNVFAREIFVTDAFASIRSEADARWKAAVQHLTATDAEFFTKELIRARSEAVAQPANIETARVVLKRISELLAEKDVTRRTYYEEMALEGVDDALKALEPRT